MKIRKVIVIAFRAIVVPVTLISIIIGILSYANITVPLEGARQQFVKKASETAGHDVRIDGEVRLAISFYPTLVVDQLHIANDIGWSAEDIISVAEARVQLALLPIISGQLEFIEISASSIQLNLEQSVDGRQNWKSFISSTKKTQQSENKATEKTPAASDKNIKQKKIWIEEFRLTDLNINYKDDKLKREFNNRIDEIVINTHDKTHLTANINGTSKDIPYRFTATSDLLRNLINNKPWHMQMQGHVADKPVNLELQLKSSNKTFDGTVKLNAQQVDIGQVLSWPGLVEGLDAYSSDLTFNADLHGGDLKQILEQSVFRINLSEGHWNLHNPANDRSRKLTFSTATLLADTDNQVKLDLTGNIDDESIQLKLTSNRLSEFFSKQEKVYLDLTTTLNHSVIKLTGNIDLPVSNRSLFIALDIKGKRLDHWNKLLNNDFPPFGPFQFNGKLNIDPKGFRVSNLKARIGDSDLGGQIFIDTSGSETHWDLNLVSHRFQINDFNVEGFSLFPEATDNAIGDVAPRARKGKKVPINGTLSKGIKESHSYANVHMTLQLEARQVLSGDDDLGGGKLQLRVTDKSLYVKNFELDIPGGFINGELQLVQHDQNVEGRLKLDMDKFDYGVLYRHIKPDSPADGLISTRIDLELSGRDFKHGLEHANGQFDFALWPENIDSSILNIWSVNLFLAILPELNKKESKFNCGVALLDVEDGTLSEELLVVDSTKIYMIGNLNVNFQQEEVSLSLFPQAKKARIFGLQAPIRINGSFDELGIAIKPSDLLIGYVKFITSPLHAPFRRIFGKNIPEDASALCGQILDREYLSTVLEEMKKKNPSLDEMYDY